MILAADSPLKRLPTQLNPRQAMFLDAIRFTIEMADFAMERLLSSLTQLSSQSPAESRSFSFAVPRLLDSWSIIDSVHRLRGLFDKLPGLRKRSQSSEFRSFLTIAKQVEALRNAVQHMNGAIGDKSAAPIRSPIWGALTWLTFQEDRTCVSSVLMPGSSHLMGSNTLINPAGRAPRQTPIDYVTLTQGDASVDLCGAMLSVAGVSRPLEQSLNEQFASLPERMLSDLVFHMVGDFSPDGSLWTIRPSPPEQ